MYNRGLSIGDISQAYGMSRQAMWMILKRRGVEFRNRLKFNSDNHFYRGGPVKNAAFAVTKAIRKGILQVHPCEVCGLVPMIVRGRHRIQAHHDDYNRLLSVRWLCKQHHDEWHKLNRAIPRTSTWKPTPRSTIASIGGLATWNKDRSKALMQLESARKQRMNH